MVNSRFTGDDVAETLGVPRGADPRRAIPGVDAGVRRRTGERLDLGRPVRADGRDARAAQEPRDARRGASAARTASSRSRSRAPQAGARSRQLDVHGVVRLGYTPHDELPRALPRRERRRLPVALRGLRHAGRRGDGVRRARRRLVASVARRGVRRRRGARRPATTPTRSRTAIRSALDAARGARAARARARALVHVARERPRAPRAHGSRRDEGRASTSRRCG